MFSILISIFVIFSNASPSDFSRNEIGPFSQVDFGNSFESVATMLDSKNVEYKISSFEKKVVIDSKETLPDGTLVDVEYDFYDGKFVSDGVVISGLYGIMLTFSDSSLSKDSQMDENFVRMYCEKLGVKYSLKKGRVFTDNSIYNDRMILKNGISWVDGVWRVFSKNGNVVEINFPSKHQISYGQEPTIYFKTKYNIYWSVDEN